VLEWVRDYYSKAELPTLKSITIDKAGGLARAVEKVFSEVPHLLCIWHINNNVETHCRKL
jgi:transposase-like protein